MTEVDLQASALRLAEAIGTVKLDERHYLSDFILVGLATDVCDQAFATLVLAGKSIAHTGFANARAAFEASLEMRVLVADPARYDEFCSLLRVYELFEFAALSARAPAVAEPLSPLEVRRRVEEVVIEDAQGWDQKFAGQGMHLRRAWETFTKVDGTRALHWSGRSRLQLLQELGGEGAEATRELDYLWGQLSMYAHPRARVGGREVVAENGKVSLGTSEATRALPVVAADLACDQAVRAIKARHGFGAAGA